MSDDGVHPSLVRRMLGSRELAASLDNGLKQLASNSDDLQLKRLVSKIRRGAAPLSALAGKTGWQGPLPPVPTPSEEQRAEAGQEADRLIFQRRSDPLTTAEVELTLSGLEDPDRWDDD